MEIEKSFRVAVPVGIPVVCRVKIFIAHFPELTVDWGPVGLGEAILHRALDLVMEILDALTWKDNEVLLATYGPL